MPIYEYECRKCGVFDYEQSIADRPLARCPKCRSKVTKLISASAFHLKGGGWYADGYDRKAGASLARDVIGRHCGSLRQPYAGCHGDGLNGKTRGKEASQGQGVRGHLQPRANAGGPARRFFRPA